MPVTLKGSSASMTRQSQVAEEGGYPYVETTDDVPVLMARGDLVPLPGNADYRINRGVSVPAARPEVRLFIERLAAQYRKATGEPLVVTSLTRASSKQPRNAHELSVHPAGIAVDLRISRRKASRQWIEAVLLKLERQGVLDVTRERWPPHYHVALFPGAYAAHVEAMIGPEALAEALYGPEVEEEEEVAVDSIDVREVLARVTQQGQAEPTTQSLFALFSLTALAAGAVRRRRRAGETG